MVLCLKFSILDTIRTSLDKFLGRSAPGHDSSQFVTTMRRSNAIRRRSHPVLGSSKPGQLRPKHVIRRSELDQNRSHFVVRMSKPVLHNSQPVLTCVTYPGNIRCR